MASHIINNRQNTIDLDKVAITVLVLCCQKTPPIVPYLKILSRNFNFIKSLELEVAQPWAELLEVHFLRSLIEHLFKMVSPFTKVANVRFQSQLLTIPWEDKVCFECRLPLDRNENAHTFICFGNLLSENRLILTLAVCGSGTSRPIY